MNRRHALKLALAGVLAGPTFAAVDPSLPGKATILKVGTVAGGWHFDCSGVPGCIANDVDHMGRQTVAGYTLEELKTIARTHAGWGKET